MSNPFRGRALSLQGPATDMIPVVPSDTIDISDSAIALYVETGGTLRVTTVVNTVRDLAVTDFSFMPLGVLRVHATGTTATGLHAMVLK